MLSGLEPVIARDGDATARQIMHKMKSRKAKSVGDYKTAFEELEKALRLDSYIFSDKDFGNLQHRTFKSELALRESKIRYNDNLARFRLIVVCLFMLLLLLLVIWYSKNRQNHMKLANMQTEAYAAEMALRLEREKKSVTSMTIAVTERERLLSEIRNATDKMHKEGKISAVAKETIEREFKIADMNKAELENLRKAYERVHPDFLKILKEKYPGLTEGDVWLALYISAGLNTKQIAYMMHLQLNSVKKNRQRLRQRMQLAPEESLQDLLRSML